MKNIVYIPNSEFVGGLFSNNSTQINNAFELKKLREKSHKGKKR